MGPLRKFIALSILLSPAVAGATISVQGRWLFRQGDGPTEFVDIAQSGASVAFTFRGAPFGGSVSSSNSVHATFGGCSPGINAADFDGDFSANASYLNARALFATCSDPSSAYAPAVFGTRCECYDGNSVNGDGCDVECRVEPCWTCTSAGFLSTCTPAADGAACEDGTDCTTGSTCSAGLCSGGTPVSPCLDMSGHWFEHEDAGSYGSHDVHVFYRQRGGIVVSGNEVPPSYGEFGTVDPATGAFRFQTVVTGSFFAYENCSRDVSTGTVAPDGATYSGSGTFSVPTIMHCGMFPVTNTGYRCGGGTLDPGEQCDDGNRTDGDGCSASCERESCAGQPDGTPCGDGNACTAGDTCAGGACTAGPAVRCPACMTCDSAAGCVAAPEPVCSTTADPARAVLVVANQPDDRRDAVFWRWPRGADTSFAALGNPLATDGYALCVFNTAAATPQLIFRATAPAAAMCRAAPCWKARGDKGFDYLDPSHTSDGIESLRLRAGVGGRASAALRGKGPRLSQRPLGLPTLPFPLPLTVQLRGDSGACFEARYDGAGVIVNDPARGRFKARAH